MISFFSMRTGDLRKISGNVGQGPSQSLASSKCHGDDTVHSARALILQSMEVTVESHIVKGAREDKFSAQKEFELPSRNQTTFRDLFYSDSLKKRKQKNMASELYVLNYI